FLSFGVLLAIAARAAGAFADPFNGSHVVPADTGSMFLMPGAILVRFAHMQMQLNDVISREFRSVHDTGSIAAALAILALAFLYGALHAAAPGHGKTIVGSYFVANESRWRSGLFMGGVISLLKGLMAIAIVVVMSLILHLKELETANQGAVVGCVSYALVVVIGCVVFWRTATGRDCGHGPTAPGHVHGATCTSADHGSVVPISASDRSATNFRRFVIAATGMVPCSSAIIIMLFALANNAIGMGIAAVAALSLGMAVTVSAVGVVGIAARPVLVRAARGAGQNLAHAERTVRLVGAAAMVAFSGPLMLGAMSQI
ncbi:MAG: hypothetical protein WCF13_04325, partial [Stellaceae bacterium]